MLQYSTCNSCAETYDIAKDIRKTEQLQCLNDAYIYTAVLVLELGRVVASHRR
jgi:hypothetical protein